MALLRLVAVALLLLVYLRAPIDLLPERAFGALGLLDDLLLIGAAIAWLRAGLRRAAARGEADAGDGATRPPLRADDARPWDPWAVLGVPRGAGPEAVARAYRERMKAYHPDRVADLGEDLRRLAHERTLEIQRAYEELRQGR